jgi:hypothetical protein
LQQPLRLPVIVPSFVPSRPDHKIKVIPLRPLHVRPHEFALLSPIRSCFFAGILFRAVATCLPSRG